MQIFDFHIYAWNAEALLGVCYQWCRIIITYIYIYIYTSIHSLVKYDMASGNTWPTTFLYLPVLFKHLKACDWSLEAIRMD